ncbi:ATPase, T2SS/T4P/T4SS family, partial [Acidithiobacillus ferrooxidans]
MNIHAHDQQEQQAHARRIEQMRRILGPEIAALFDDTGVVEIMANPDGRVFVERLGSGISPLGEIDASRVQSLLGLMADYLHTTVSRDRPIVEGAMPIEFLRSRFAGAIPPMVEGASFSIRLPARSVYTLDQYVEAGIITAAQMDTLSDAVLSRKNILVSGGTGSGKTTLANALIDRISKLSDIGTRIVIIEDTRELQCTAP